MSSTPLSLLRTPPHSSRTLHKKGLLHLVRMHSLEAIRTCAQSEKRFTNFNPLNDQVCTWHVLQKGRKKQLHDVLSRFLFDPEYVRSTTAEVAGECTTLNMLLGGG